MTGAAAPPPTMPGFAEWFRPGDHAGAERVADALRAAGVTRLRAALPWADHHAPGGRDWHDWLLPRLGATFRLLARIHGPPARPGAPGAPERLRDYVDFVGLVLDRYGEQVEALELRAGSDASLGCDGRTDAERALWAEAVGNAADQAHARGLRAVLGAPALEGPGWLDALGRAGVLARIDAVGVQDLPGAPESAGGARPDWSGRVAELREALDHHGSDAEVWIIAAGHPTWAHDELEQVRRFRDAAAAPADRVYWCGWRDLAPDMPGPEGLGSDPRLSHLGAVSASGRPKLLGRLLVEGGMRRIDDVLALAAPAVRGPARPVVITGGSGFVGANLADSFLADGDDVVILDNLSRPGVDQNLAWLRDRHGPRVHPHVADIRNARALGAALDEARAVVHLAGQTAVTTSMAEPLMDFEANARGTMTLLEAVRARGPVPLIFASTNKVYGDLAHLLMEDFPDRHLPRDPEIRARGIDEHCPLQLCTPYGCSKGVADQYVLDYAKSFGLQTAVLRMSCIYGQHQFGTEDQGWVAHFLLRALAGEEITVFGDGRQVRDVLHVDDAVAAYRLLLERIDRLAGQAFNLGGGPRNAISLNMLLDEIGRIAGHAPPVRHEGVRPGDQLYFVADTGRLEAETGWRARMPWKQGVAALWDWLAEHRLGRAPAAPAKGRVPA